MCFTCVRLFCTMQVNNLKEHLSKIEAQYKDTQDNLDASEQKITLYQQKVIYEIVI